MFTTRIKALLLAAALAFSMAGPVSAGPPPPDPNGCASGFTYTSLTRIFLFEIQTVQSMAVTEVGKRAYGTAFKIVFGACYRTSTSEAYPQGMTMWNVATPPGTIRYDSSVSIFGPSFWQSSTHQQALFENKRSWDFLMGGFESTIRMQARVNYSGSWYYLGATYDGYQSCGFAGCTKWATIYTPANYAYD